ncbi:MAG: hypothetical protein V4706_02775 [Pseudomonadota bacterium]
MEDLPFLARRVLRIVASHQSIAGLALEAEADLDAGIHSETSLLMMCGLIDRNKETGTYSITVGGAQCVANFKPPKPRKPL